MIRKSKKHINFSIRNGLLFESFKMFDQKTKVILHKVDYPDRDRVYDFELDMVSEKVIV